MSQFNHIKAHQIAHINGSRRVFSPTHPFWLEAVRLRQQFASYESITERARILGYTELSPATIQYGMKERSGLLDLPQRGGRSMQIRYARANESFDELELMRSLIADCDREIAQIDELLESTELSAEAIDDMGTRRDALRTQMFNWSKEYAHTKAELRGPVPESIQPQLQTPLSGLQWLDKVAEDFHNKLALPDPADIRDIYGADNIHFPERSVMDVRVTSAEDA